MKSIVLAIAMVMISFVTSMAQDLVPKKDSTTTKWGYADSEGQWVIHPQFEAADSFYNGKAKVYKDKKYGVIRPDGEYALKLKYPDMYAYKGSYLVPDVLLGDEGYWYFYKEQPGTDKLKKKGLRACKIENVPGGYVLYGEEKAFGGGMWGIYFDPNGPIFEEGFTSYNASSDYLNFKYADGHYKTYDLAAQRQKEREAYFKKISGGADYTLPILRDGDRGDVVGYFFSKNGITEIASADGTRTGHKVKADYVLRTQIYGKYFIVSGGKYGMMYLSSVEDSCKILIPCQADSIVSVKRGEHYSDHLYFAYKNGKCGLWELNDAKEILPIKFDELRPLSDYYESYWYANINGKWGVYNDNGKCVVPTRYDGVGQAENGWKVKVNGKWGIIEEGGKLLIPCKFGYIWSISTNNLTGYSSFRTPLYYFKDNYDQDGSSGIVNKYGKIIYRWNNGNSTFVRFYNDYLIVKKGNKYGAIWCNTGKLVIPFVMDWVPGEDDFAGSNRYRILMGKDYGRRATMYVYGPNGKLVVSKVFNDLNTNYYLLERFVRTYLM